MAPDILQSVLRAAHLRPRRDDGDKPVPTVTLVEVALHDRPHHERQASTNSTLSKFDSKREWLLQHHRKIRRLGRIVAAAANAITATLSAVIEVLMCYVLYKFYSTSGLFISGRPWGPWAKQSVIWPTFMFAIASLITSILAVASLIALFHQSKQKAASFSLVYLIVHIVLWIIVAIIYRAEKTEKDLWGWSCTDKAQFIDRRFTGNTVHFESLCDIQEASWVMSIAHIVIAVFSGAVAWYFDYERRGVSTELARNVGSVLDQIV